LISLLAALGRRAAIVLWWPADTVSRDRAFDALIWLFRGFALAPWTMMMYVAVMVGGVAGFDWIWIALGVHADLSVNIGSWYRNRDRMPVYVSRSSTPSRSIRRAQ
jgi:hypothetical protein